MNYSFSGLFNYSEARASGEKDQWAELWDPTALPTVRISFGSRATACPGNAAIGTEIATLRATRNKNPYLCKPQFLIINYY